MSIKNENYIRFGSLLAKEDKGDELEEILIEAANIVSEIKGCYQYLIGRDLNNPDLIWISEIWESKQDHAASLENENVRKLINNAIPILDDQPRKSGEATIVGGFMNQN